MNYQEELDLMEKWYRDTVLESLKTLTKLRDDPKKASREMNRLERHSIYQLRRTVKLGFKGEKA